MFYSQFILAKKGPLGTIWIAAHLERKLRKNQVADTDIGVSVDSILFPDAPIALRLSSHLLLGVVRIYSKKVNYLFHDCSEALIKIKQAFRSTAVDLPPEESTAPYHSITLPETFDLDNFELPDSAFLDSNFVDHHVSTREQITLQDTVNDNAFPTSKFGLDERFGDGDASQIGLELDEDLFMEKNISQQHDGFSMDSKVSGVHHGETSVPSSSTGIDVQFGYDEEKGRKVPNDLSELLSNNYDRNSFSSAVDLRRDVSSHRHGYSIQTPDLNEVFLPDCHTALSPTTPHIPFTPEEAQTPCLMEPAQAPSTPGLLEEVIPSNFQEVPALSPQEKAGICVDSGRSGLCSSPHMEVECTEVGNKPGMTSGALGQKSGETAEELPPCTTDLIAPTSESLPPIHSNVNLNKIDIVHLVSGAENQQSGLTREAENAADHRQGNVEAIFPSGYSHEAANIPSTPKPAASFETELVTSNTCTDNLDIIGVTSDVKGASLDDNNAPSDIGNLVRLEDGGSCISINTSAVGTDFVLRSCGSNLHPPSSHMVYGALGETSELSNRDHCCNFRTPVREDALNICESSFEVQGGDSCYTNGRVMNLDGQQTLVGMPSIVKSVATKQDDLSTGVLSNFFQLDRVNYSSSSEFLGPDKMLAPACDVGYPNQGLQTICQGVIESHGSIDMTSSHCSRKRRIMDSSATLQNGSSAKLSGIPRSRRNADYIPDDDDVLASILVGRKAPSLKMGQTTPLSKASSQKRPRTISRLGMPKRRKVLVDDTMVLQADAIRHQLINTEDIRRMRKKAPCTRPEIWRIYMGAMEDEIFYHSALIGVSLQLNNLNDQYVLQRDPHVKTSGEAVSSGVLEFVNETGDKEKGGRILSMPGIIGEMRGPISDTIPSHQGISLQLNNLNDQYVLQRDSHVKTSGEAASSRVLEFVNETGDKEKGGSILSMPGIIGEMRGPISDTIPSHQGISLQLSNLNDQYVLQRDPHVKTSGEAVSSRVLEFVNETGDKEKGGSTLSMPGIIGEMRGPISDTIPSHQGISLQLNNLNDQYVLQRDPHVKTSGEAVSSRVLEFGNETGDKGKGGSILSMPGIIGEMRKTISDIIPSHEGSAQSNVHDPLVEVLDRPHVKTSGEAVSFRDLEFVNEMGDKEKSGSILSMPSIIGEMRGPISDTIPSHGSSAQSNVHDPLVEVLDRPQAGPLSNDQVAVISSMEADANSIIQETLIPEIDKGASFLEKPDDKSINLAERSAYTEAPNPLNTSNEGSDSTECVTIVGINGDSACAAVVSETFIQAENVCNAVGATINEEDKTGNAVDAKYSESNYAGLASDVGTDEVFVTDGSTSVVQGDEAPEQGLKDVKRPITDVAWGVRPNFVSFESSIEHTPSTMGENSYIHKFNLEGDPDMGNMAVDIGAARDSSDFCSAINDSYTGFLNVDDEPDLDEPENEAPNPEAQSLENSGWSARTRGVARYLKLLFDEESGRGRKTIAVDRLLAGKTRKEASRMFFETLVLKTRDYIQVEQEKPFECINIKPRTKLLVSEF